MKHQRLFFQTLLSLKKITQTTKILIDRSSTELSFGQAYLLGVMCHRQLQATK
jgi:hypothetical protein